MCLFTKKPETTENSGKMQNESSVDQNQQENIRATSADTTIVPLSTFCISNTTTSASNEVVTFNVKAEGCIIPNPVSLAAAKSNLSDDKGKLKKPASLHYVSSFKLTAKSTSKSTVKTYSFPIPEARMSNHFDAKGFMPEKPSTSSPTLSFLSHNAKKKFKPAHVYIFNHEKFDTENDRVGTARDVKALRKTFELFKCNVDVINNATVATIRSTVQKLESENFKEQSALVIVILTHGDRHDKLAAKDSEYSLDDDMIFPISRNQTLANKPKLVFVQACKGRMAIDGNQERYNLSEILKCYSTYEGFASYRDRNSGTPFIQTLCEVLQKSGQTKDIQAIMMDVRIAVKKNYGQIPSELSTLTTKYVFGDYM